MLSDELRNQLFDYVDGRLSESQRQEFEEQLHINALLREEYEAMQVFMQAKEDWSDAQVPRWDRVRGINRMRQQAGLPWFQWVSLAFSLIAVVLVVSNAQISHNEEGFTIAFNGGGVTQEDIDKKLENLRLEQQNFMTAQVKAMEDKSLAMNKQVLTAALDFNREVRRQDIAELASYWAKTRSEDLRAIQLIQDQQEDDQRAIEQLYARLTY